MLGKKVKDHKDINDLKKANNELYDLFKEIKKEAKASKDEIILNALNRIDLDIDYKSVLMKNFTPHNYDDVCKITEFIKNGLLDSQELLRKGTSYGVQLSLNRIETLIADRKVAKSPFLVKAYYDFESNLWQVIKLRELAYGEIERLKEKQDNITKTALTEKDSMMRVRYFEDMRVIEKDILRLENEAHRYDTIQMALHNEEILKNVLQTYAVTDNKLVKLEDFEQTVEKYGKR